MANNFSDAYYEQMVKRLRFTPLWFKIKFAPFIKRWRILQLKLSNHALVRQSAAMCSVQTNFDAQGEHYQKHGWAFVDPMLASDFHAEIISNWPKKYYLEPPREVGKSYNTGFRWKYGDKRDFGYSDPYGQYPTMGKFLQYLRSPEFVERVKTFAGFTPDHEYMLYSFIINDGGTGSEVIPHKDGIRDDPKAKDFMNMIFFINATGGKNSGGLTLSRDPEIKDIMFEPAKLVNTCLIYDIIGNFYHGFPPIAPGKFRWVITAQYCGRAYVDKYLNV